MIPGDVSHPVLALSFEIRGLRLRGEGAGRFVANTGSHDNPEKPVLPHLSAVFHSWGQRDRIGFVRPRKSMGSHNVRSFEK